MTKTLKADDVINLLLNEKADKKKVVLLFDDNRALQNFSNVIGSKIMDHPNFVFDRNTPFTVKNNFVQYGDRKVFFGLKAQELALTEAYSDEEIHVYEKQE